MRSIRALLEVRLTAAKARVASGASEGRLITISMIGRPPRQMRSATSVPRTSCVPTGWARPRWPPLRRVPSTAFVVVIVANSSCRFVAVACAS